MSGIKAERNAISTDNQADGETEAIRPCPFCGAAGYLDTVGYYGGEDEHDYSCMVVCEGCGAQGPVKNCNDAVEAWNRRENPAAPSEDALSDAFVFGSIAGWDIRHSKNVYDQATAPALHAAWQRGYERGSSEKAKSSLFRAKISQEEE